MPRPSVCIDITVQALIAGQPVWWWGQPGVGKTECARVVAEKIGDKMECPFPMLNPPPAVAMESVDVRGLPRTEGGRTRWTPPVFWPMQEDWCGLVFLDELAQGSSEVVNSYSMAVQSHHIGDDLPLPKGLRWLAASNRMEDRAGAKRVGSHMLRRFLHLDFEPSLEDWQSWAIERWVAPDVRGFLNFRPALFQHFDSALNNRADCNPRSWFNVSRLLPHVDEHNLHMAVSGLVGEGPASEFIAFRQIYLELPDLDAVLANPSKATIPASKPAIMYALCTALAEKSRDMKSLDNLAEYAMRFPAEFSALCVRDVYAANIIKHQAGSVSAPAKITAGKMTKWIKQHCDVLLPGAK